jgi:predicted O-linked N-acetylglucosamine transferase (SPINDLY family)
LEEAQNLCEIIINNNPESHEANHLLGIVNYHKKSYIDSIENFEKAINLNPNNAEYYSNLGSVYSQIDNVAEAIKNFDKALIINPLLSLAHSNRGNELIKINLLEEGIKNIDEAIKIDPNNIDAHYNKGIALTKLNNISGAIESYKTVIRKNNKYAPAYINIGAILFQSKKYLAAIENFDKAIIIQPDSTAAYSNKGAALTQLQQFSAAVESYDKAISLNPNFAEAYSNRGNALRELGLLSAAKASIEKAIAINPNFAEAFNNYGGVFRLNYQYVDALQAIGRALEINPNIASAMIMYGSMFCYLSEYKNICELSESALALASEDKILKIWESKLYHYIYHPDLTAQEICAEHIRWGNQFEGLGAETFVKHDRTPERRLRVGYVSPDFREHTCRFYFDPLFSSHDRSRFELFAYSNVLIKDEHTERMRSYFYGWRDIVGVSDEGVAQLIRQDKIDILVDCCGHMIDTRLTVFAHKPAPIQVTWLGAAWTTGLPQMDYVLFDPHMAPEGTAASEQIVRLPRTWTAFRPGGRARQAAVNESPAATKGAVTFGYSGRSERLNHRVFSAWGRIMDRLPQARLVLDYKAFADPKTQLYYGEFLKAHGVDTGRVVMRNSENIFEGLGDIDILLDSFPHSGGTMLFDAIWMGVPVLTLASQRPVGRIGTSLMNNLGLPKWVAKTEKEYEDKAVEFAQDIPALANLRSTMRAKMQASPVMDEKGFAQDVEAAYKNMWSNWIDDSS